jgi:ketosteroid isomerase-like protein
MPPRKRNTTITNATLVAAALLLSLAVQGCAHTAAPKDTRAEDEATIRAYSQAYNDAVRARDVEKSLSFYTDDALGFGDQDPLTTSKEAMRPGMQEGYAVSGWTIDWKTEKVMVARSGDLAYEYGRYKFTGTQKDGKPATRTGNYLLVWKKSPGGDWKIAVDTDAADQPPAPPTK